MIADLDELARSLTTGAEPFAFCGIAVSLAGQRSFAVSSQRDVAPDTYWRAASISKIVVGRVAKAIFGDGHATVEEVLGQPFVSPMGDRPTIAQLASHQSGIWDNGGYLVPPAVDLSDWLTKVSTAIWSDAPPGRQLIYSNLGYLILAACCERASGRPLSDLANTYVFEPLRLTAGFNWVGMPDPHSVLPTYRRDAAGAFQPQIDAPPVAPDMTAYRIGETTASLSPQGGLRLSLRGALALAESLSDGPKDRLWFDPAPAGPLFQHYGWGLQIYDAPVFYPRPLIGHFANAYGFCGGVWHDPAAQISFAYGLNGLAEGDEADGLRAEEIAIFDAIAQMA